MALFIYEKECLIKITTIMDKDLSELGMFRCGKDLKPKEIKILEEIGMNIRYQRLSHNISLSNLSYRAGISRTTLHKMENGVQGVSLCSYIKVLSVLNIADQLTEIGSRMVILKRKNQEKMPLRKRASRMYY